MTDPADSSPVSKKACRNATPKGFERSICFTSTPTSKKLEFEDVCKKFRILDLPSPFLESLFRTQFKRKYGKIQNLIYDKKLNSAIIEINDENTIQKLEVLKTFHFQNHTIAVENYIEKILSTDELAEPLLNEEEIYMNNTLTGLNGSLMDMTFHSRESDGRPEFQTASSSKQPGEELNKATEFHQDSNNNKSFSIHKDDEAATTLSNLQNVGLNLSGNIFDEHIKHTSTVLVKNLPKKFYKDHFVGFLTDEVTKLLPLDEGTDVVEDTSDYDATSHTVKVKFKEVGYAGSACLIQELLAERSAALAVKGDTASHWS